MPDNLRTLYVDDEPGLLEVAKMFLEQSGDFSVETIESATGALELLKNEQFDAIISDYQMPCMDQEHMSGSVMQKSKYHQTDNEI